MEDFPQQHATSGTPERLCNVLSKKLESLIEGRGKNENFGAGINDRSQCKQRTFSICRQKKDPGFPAKWICRDCIRPGVTPCKGQKDKK